MTRAVHEGFKTLNEVLLENMAAKNGQLLVLCLCIDYGIDYATPTINNRYPG